jgi:hypothetical protein
MLSDGRCTIYEHRPRTCRTYDCRVFPATGLTADDGGADAGKVAVAVRARRWRFSFPAGEDRAHHAATRRAAASLREQVGQDPGAVAPTVTQIAVRAIETYEEFL